MGERKILNKGKICKTFRKYVFMFVLNLFDLHHIFFIVTIFHLISVLNCCSVRPDVKVNRLQVINLHL